MSHSIISQAFSACGTSDLNITQKLLYGLGKSTKRGIKKCTSCGIYNGSRSTMCKNKQCGIVLKEEEKSKIDLDAVKLLTGTSKQIYSVRVKDMGPDSRGFVQLPLLPSPAEDDTNIFSEVALCFVSSCQNSFDNSILKCHEEDQNGNNLLCIHIKSALKSQSTASHLLLKKDILQLLNVSNEFRNNLFVIASEKEGYVVQQVSKSVMAVKCQVSPKHPLGYLHFTFIISKNGESYEEYYCSCEKYSGRYFLFSKCNKVQFYQILGIEPKKCIHYYACIWAVASDSKFYGEFSHFIQKEVSFGKLYFFSQIIQ